MTHPEPGPGQEPPTLAEPTLPAQPAAPQPPTYQQGSAAVPRQFAPQPAETYPYSAAPEYGAYPSPDYGGYAPPPKRRTGLIAGIVIGVLVLCVAGSVGGGLAIVAALKPSSSASAPNPGSPASYPGSPAATPSGRQTDAAATTPPAATFTGDLRTLLVPRPAGAKPWDEYAGSDGTLTLDQTTKLFVDPTGVGNELRKRNFARGAVMHWSDGDVFVLIFLFQFDSATDSAAYVADQGRNGVSGYAAKGEFSGISGSMLLTDETPDSNGDRSTITLTSHGDIATYITMWHPDTIDLTAATTLALQQQHLLP